MQQFIEIYRKYCLKLIKEAQNSLNRTECISIYISPTCPQLVIDIDSVD